MLQWLIRVVHRTDFGKIIGSRHDFLIASQILFFGVLVLTIDGAAAEDKSIFIPNIECWDKALYVDQVCHPTMSGYPDLYCTIGVMMNNYAFPAYYRTCPRVKAASLTGLQATDADVSTLKAYQNSINESTTNLINDAIGKAQKDNDNLQNQIDSLKKDIVSLKARLDALEKK